MEEVQGQPRLLVGPAPANQRHHSLLRLVIGGTKGEFPTLAHTAAPAPSSAADPTRLEEPYRRESWAALKDASGKLDHNTSITGDALRGFIILRLFPYLRGVEQKARGAETIEYKMGEMVADLGRPDEIEKVFAGIQKYLYQDVA